MTLLAAFLVGIASFWLGFWCGWRARNRYWTNRILTRPRSTHLSLYPNEKHESLRQQKESNSP